MAPRTRRLLKPFLPHSASTARVGLSTACGRSPRTGFARRPWRPRRSADAPGAGSRRRPRSAGALSRLVTRTPPRPPTGDRIQPVPALSLPGPSNNAGWSALSTTSSHGCPYRARHDHSTSAVSPARDSSSEAPACRATARGLCGLPHPGHRLIQPPGKVGILWRQIPLGIRPPRHPASLAHRPREHTTDRDLTTRRTVLLRTPSVARR
jgi:hypothetical protein